MDYKELMELIDHLDQSTVSYVDYKIDSHHLIISKELPQFNVQTATPQQEERKQIHQKTVEIGTENEVETLELADTTEEKAGVTVQSPMVGVAYLQPNPDADPYVKVGDYVEQGDVICIIEAMKLMNEIQATHAGTVTEILVENEEVVEFNQDLIRIKE